MIHTHAKLVPLDFINKKRKAKRRFFTQTEHPFFNEKLMRAMSRKGVSNCFAMSS